MSKTAVEKSWEIPAHDGKGPITIVLRMPDVVIIDSRGRHILVATEQAHLLSAKMGYVANWIRDAAVD
ncbi:MAG: hypothetical protein M3460_01980 [Actinomycetota bacterium]|nr:hypothetical protein [Actinomycetota bacterium]